MQKYFHYVLLLVVAAALSGCITARTDSSFKVMTYNIHHGEGADGKMDLERIAQVILTERVDIAGLQEIDRGVQRSARRDLIAELAKLTGMHFYFEPNKPYQGGDYGNAVLTRFPILQQTNTHFKMLRPNEQRGVQQVLLNVNGRRVVFMNTHLDYRPDDQERQMNVEELRQLVASYKPLPVIIAGDFNDEPATRIHDTLKTFLQDPWESKGQGQGFTLYSDNPIKRIDFVWNAPHDSLTLQNVWVPFTIASDHLPVIAEFHIK